VQNIISEALHSPLIKQCDVQVWNLENIISHRLEITACDVAKQWTCVVTLTSLGHLVEKLLVFIASTSHRIRKINVMKKKCSHGCQQRSETGCM